MSRSYVRSTAALLTLALSAAAHALPPQLFVPDKNAAARANIILPATITKLNDMDFGFVTVTSAGTATIDSNSGAVTTTGGVQFAGGLPHAAQFAAVSPDKAIVRIQLPTKPATLTRVGGTETMTVDSWTINGNQLRTLVAHQTLSFAVGGTLHVNASQVEGTYTGTFAVTIVYN